MLDVNSCNMMATFEAQRAGAVAAAPAMLAVGLLGSVGRGAAQCRTLHKAEGGYHHKSVHSSMIGSQEAAAEESTAALSIHAELTLQDGRAHSWLAPPFCGVLACLCKAIVSTAIAPIGVSMHADKKASRDHGVLCGLTLHQPSHLQSVLPLLRRVTLLCFQPWAISRHHTGLQTASANCTPAQQSSSRQTIDRLGRTGQARATPNLQPPLG